MSELENFNAGKESRADVVSRAGRSGGHSGVAQRMVEAAFYRETHRAEPTPPIDDEPEPTADNA